MRYKHFIYDSLSSDSWYKSKMLLVSVIRSVASRKSENCFVTTV